MSETTMPQHRLALNEHVTALDFDMAGGKVVEASAGTGKTYQIQTLYLRLIVEQGLAVRQALVVTFTDAATKELRDRLRAILYTCRQHLDSPLDPDSHADARRIIAVCALPLRDCDPAVAADPDAAAAERRRRLDQALLDFDAAAIYTIHGFCSRVLDRYAFETGSDFGMALETDDSGMLLEVCQDWWRRHMYADDSDMRVLQLDPRFSLSRLLQLLRGVESRPLAVLEPAPLDRDRALAALEANLRRLATNADLLLDSDWMDDRQYRPLKDVQLLGDAARTYVELLEGHPPASLETRVETALALLQAAGKKLGLTALVNGKASARASTDRGEELRAILGSGPEELLAPLYALLGGTLRELAGLYRVRKQEKRLRSFSDLLTGLYEAMHDPRRAPGLIAALRREFRAGMIDEFQDTDPVQYAIFHKLLLESGLPTVLVGDPKQAIYAFRSGDIFTYYAATQAVAEAAAGRLALYTLDRNFRSEAAMVGAVNAVFRDQTDPQTGALRPGFLTPHIAFPGSLKAQGKKPAASLTVGPDAQPDPAPLKLWYYAIDGVTGSKRKPGADSPFANRLYADTADAIAALLNDPETRLGGRPLRPADFCVLVLRHREGEAIAAELAARGVPAVRQKTGNVFTSPEAGDLALLLRAMVDPGNLTALRSALVTGLFGLDDADLLALEQGELREAGAEPAPHSLADLADLFREAGTRWRERSFIEAFNLLDRRLGLRGHAIDAVQGERRLTNILHLAELLHRAATEQRLGPEGLAHWLSARLQDPEPKDAHEMRLETDAEAVKIMTVFRSKGLQFPVVFVPTFCLLEPGLTARETSARYHPVTRDPAAPDGDVLHMDLTLHPEARTAAETELLQEQVRQLYVALTRAVHRTYLAWGDIATESNTVLAEVLDGGALRVRDRVAELQAADARLLCLGDPPGADPDASASGQVALHLITDPTPAAPTWYQPPAGDVSPDALQPLDLRLGYRIHVPKELGHNSFTAIASSMQGRSLEARYAFDEPDEPATPEDAELLAARAVPGIFRFPAGAKTGSCWHRIYELLDFRSLASGATPEQEADARAVVDRQLALFRLAQGRSPAESTQRRDAVWHMVQQTLTADLPGAAGDAPLRLCELPPAETQREFTFDFPMARGRVTIGAITALLQAHWGAEAADATAAQRYFAAELGYLSAGAAERELPGGYMTGSIDLFARRGGPRGRYFLLDWKSNKRGGLPADFDATGLQEEMATHAYYLQYLIYTVAAHQYLRGALGAAYAYDGPGDGALAGFGGAYYLFVRAVDATQPGLGVFYDRPSLALVEALGTLLGDFATGGPAR